MFFFAWDRYLSLATPRFLSCSRTKPILDNNCTWLTLSQTIYFRLFQTKRVCRRQFQIDENGRKVSTQVENTVGKGEISRYEQFLLFPLCFQKTCIADTYKLGLVWERVNLYNLIKGTLLFFWFGPFYLCTRPITTITTWRGWLYNSFKGKTFFGNSRVFFFAPDRY